MTHPDRFDLRCLPCVWTGSSLGGCREGDELCTHCSARAEIGRLRKIADDLARWVQGSWMCPSEHQCSEVGNAFGGYDCECGAPWLTDGCPAAAALAAYQALPCTQEGDQ